MSTVRDRSRARPTGTAKAAARTPKPKKGSLKDLEAKHTEAVQGEACCTGKHYDQASLNILPPPKSGGG